MNDLDGGVWTALWMGRRHIRRTAAARGRCHALIGCVEAHDGRGVRNTSDTMTMIGVGSGHHDVSKSRQTAAS